MLVLKLTSVPRAEGGSGKPVKRGITIELQVEGNLLAVVVAAAAVAAAAERRKALACILVPSRMSNKSRGVVFLNQNGVWSGL